jgi:hypothetical protein
MKIEELKKQYDHERYLKNREKILKRTREWAKNNSERRKEIQRNWRKNKYWENPSYRTKEILNASKRSKAKTVELRLEILRYYGGLIPKCSLCQTEDIEVLDIDHIDGGGSAQRRNQNLLGSKFYYWLKRNNFPDGFRVLCRNCNWKEYLRKKENKNEH